jgi:hypothetical protein
MEWNGIECDKQHNTIREEPEPEPEPESEPESYRQRTIKTAGESNTVGQGETKRRRKIDKRD